MQPSIPPPYAPSQQDTDHLKLLSVFHFVLAGLALLGAVITLVQLFMMNGFFRDFHAVSRSTGVQMDMGGLDPVRLITVWSRLILFFLAGSALVHFLCGLFLAMRRHRTFCFLAACFSRLNIPLGLVLGVFTILVLQRPSVRGLFDREAALT